MGVEHNRTLLRAVVLAGAATLGACGGGGGGGESSPPPSQPVTPARVVQQSDLEIASLLYADSARTPPDFFTDTAPPPGAAYVATFHLKTTDLAVAAGQHELCTDDWNEALQWSETVAGNAASYADLVATQSNSRFFEFGRVPRDPAGGYVRARVYRCAYLDRVGVDLRAPGIVAGHLNRRPLSSTDLRELSEYLWLFTSFNNFGNVVLRSSGSASASRLEHTLYIARLQRAADAGGCDRIEVLSWLHSADTQSGELQLHQEALWSFGARQMSGGIELCAEGS